MTGGQRAAPAGALLQVERRLLEAERLGFRRCLLPEAALARPAGRGAKPKTKLELLPAATLREAIKEALS